MIFSQTQICHTTCKPGKCIGPEEYHCIECQNGYGLVGNTRPNRCVILNLVCHVSCNTCFGTSYTQCLTCKNATQVPIEGTCASSAPAFWNKLVQVQYDWSISEPLSLYYGFSYDLNYIYFRFRGYVTNMLNGWLYLQFGTTGVNEDVVALRIFDGVILVEDRFIQTPNTLPLLDAELNGASNYFHVSGTKINRRWNVVFARKAKTGDTFDELIDITPRYFQVFAGHSGSVNGGSNEYFNDQYAWKYDPWNKYRFYNKQLCTANCVACVGPEEDDCTACETMF